MRKAGYTRIDDVLRVVLTDQGRTLPSHLRLAGYRVVREPLPRTRLGKLRRFLLPAIYEGAAEGRERPAAPALTDADQVFLDSRRKRDAWALLVRRYPGRLAGIDDSLALDLGVDSLEWMSLALEVEDRLGVSLREDAMARVFTVRDLLAALDEAPGRGAPEPAALAALARESYPMPPGLARAAARFLWGLNRVLMRALFRVTVRGRPEPPATGPFVLISNHASDLDPLLLGAALPGPVLRRVCWSAAVDRLPGGRWAGAILAEAGVFPVDERSARQTLEAAAAVLDRGDGLVWFPESWRSPDGQLQRFLPGLARVLEGRDIAVLPAHIAGSFKALPRYRRWPRLVPVTVRFGQAVNTGTLEREGTGETPVDRLTDAMRARVAALSDASSNA
jgi:long-chain acyl-CoA synthetase